MNKRANHISICSMEERRAGARGRIINTTRHFAFRKKPWLAICAALALFLGHLGALNAADVTFTLGQVSGEIGSEVVVPLQVTGFTNVGTFQFSMNWNAAVAKLIRIEQMNLGALSDANFNTNPAASGIASVSWNEVNGGTTNLADNSVVFALRFLLLGPIGTNTSVSVSGYPTAIEVSDGTVVMPATFVRGQITITAPATLTLSLPQTNALTGSEVLLPVQVSQFSNIASFQFSMHWPASAGTFVGVESFGFAGLTAGNFASPANGTLTVSWADSAGQSKSLPADATLFAVRLRAQGALDTPNALSIDGTPTAIEVYNANAVQVSVNTVPGQFTTVAAPTFTALAESQTLCIGSTVQLSVQAEGSPPLYYVWRKDGTALNDDARHSGTQTRSLTIASTQPTDAGSYSVVVSNAYGMITSAPPAVLVLNTAPALAQIPNATIPDGYPFSFRAYATNLDTSAQNLTFSLRNAPSGATIDPSTGVFTWTPDEVNGPGSYTLSVVVSDDCSPSLSTTQDVRLTVVESNSPPAFTAPSGTLIAYVLEPIYVTNVVIDPDWPTNEVTFSLVPGVSAKWSKIQTNTGVYMFLPQKTDALTTKTVSVIATDNGTPPLSTTNTFSIFVDDYVEMALGRTVLRAGDIGSVPISFSASSGVTNLTATIVAANTWLTGLSIANQATVMNNASVTATGPNTWELRLTAKPGQSLTDGVSPGDLVFTAQGTTSAFVHLTISNVVALRVSNGLAVPRTITNPGRAVVVNIQPLLEPLLTNGNERVLILYAQPGYNYVPLSSPGLGAGASWQNNSPESMDSLYRVIHPATLNNGTVFFRGMR